MNWQQHFLRVVRDSIFHFSLHKLTVCVQIFLRKLAPPIMINCRNIIHLALIARYVNSIAKTIYVVYDSVWDQLFIRFRQEYDLVDVLSFTWIRLCQKCQICQTKSLQTRNKLSGINLYRYITDSIGTIKKISISQLI